MMKIKCLEIVEGCKFEINPKGDWIDLKLAKDYEFKGPKVTKEKNCNRPTILFDEQMVDFGIAMQLPPGVIADVDGRSSTSKKFFIDILSTGKMDNAYRGAKDMWRGYVRASKATSLKKGERIAQFELRLSQYATLWQRIKWFFRGKLEFVWVTEEEFGNIENRGGFGTSGR